MRMNTELLLAVLAAPADDAPRLVLADWMDENSDGIADTAFGGQLRAAFIRWQITGVYGGVPFVPRYKNEMPYNLAWFCDKRHLWSADRLSKLIRDANGNPQPGDRKFGSYGWNHEDARTVWTEASDVRLTYRRGFVDEVSMTAAAFLRHAGELFATQPVTRVRIPDMPIFPSGGNDTYYVGGLGQFPQKYWRRLEGLPSRQAALVALSAAGVEYGREAAGL